MIVWLGALAVAVAVGGVGMMVLALVGGPGKPDRATARSGYSLRRSRLATTWGNLTPTHHRLLVAGLVAGVVVAALTRWMPALVIAPLLVAGVPGLLTDPPNRDVIVLQSLDRWVRALTASLLTGRSVPDAIRATRRQAPEAIAEAVTLAGLRLDERWPLPEAMAAFADDVDHPEADAVAAALVVAGQRGTGAAATLGALADALQDRLTAARDVDNERAKPRIVVRQVTVIIVVVMAVSLITSPAYFAPYGHGLGPWLAVVLALVYVGALAKLRAASTPAVRPRLRLRLTGAAVAEVKP